MEARRECVRKDKIVLSQRFCSWALWHFVIITGRRPHPKIVVGFKKVDSVLVSGSVDQRALSIWGFYTAFSLFNGILCSCDAGMYYVLERPVIKKKKKIKSISLR